MSGRMRLRIVVTGIAASAVLVGTLGARPQAQTQQAPTTVRQNPNIDRPITNENFDSAVVMLLQQLVAVYGPIANSNDRPNPYTRVEPYGEPPPGNNGEWAAVTGAEGGPDGTSTYSTGARPTHASTGQSQRSSRSTREPVKDSQRGPRD